MTVRRIDPASPAGRAVLALPQIPQADGPFRCEWFALCDHDATVLCPHSVLGAVPTCDRCALRLADDETRQP